MVFLKQLFIYNPTDKHRESKICCVFVFSRQRLFEKGNVLTSYSVECQQFDVLAYGVGRAVLLSEKTAALFYPSFPPLPLALMEGEKWKL